MKPVKVKVKREHGGKEEPSSSSSSEEEKDEEEDDDDKYDPDLDLEADFPQGNYLLYTEW